MNQSADTSNQHEKTKKNWLLPVLLLIIGLAAGFGGAAVLGVGQEQQVSVTLAADPAETADKQQPESAAQATDAILSPEQPEEQKAQTEQELYEAAVRDSVFAEEDEILPLVSLTKEDSRVTWNEAGDRVLLLTWHNYPESYPTGDTVALKWGAVWTFADGEILDRYTSEADKITDWDMRLKQLIGFPPEGEHTTITGFWVRPEDVVRPAYQPDPTNGEMVTGFDESVDPDFKAWFDGNIVWSYFESAYPWTRLGYTYDWADNGTKYGLSEFLVNQNSEVETAFTISTEEFLTRLSEGAVIPPTK